MTSRFKQMREWFDIVREQVMTDALLKPRMLAKETYTERPVTLQPLDPIFRAEIDTEVRDFNFDCQLLACGFDEGTAALFTVDDGGFDHAKQGFACVGSGGGVALSELLWSDVNPNDDLDVMLYNAYAAKAHAEMTPFVGYDLDIWILLPDTDLIWVPKEIKDLLGKVFDKADRGPFKHRKEWESQPGWKRPERVPKNWEKQLKDYVDSVAGKWREPT